MTTRNILSESPIIIATSEVGQFANGDTVVISVYRNGSGTPEALDLASCTQIGTTGIFWWGFLNLTNAPTVFSDYKWIMTDSGSKFASGNERFGGFVDTINANVGANSVTLTIEETDTTAIANAEVQLLNTAQTIILDTKTTDVNGQVVFSADDGSYKVRLSKAQTTFTVPETLTVSGTTTQTYNGTPLTIASGAGAGECELSIFASSQRPTIALASLAGTAQIVSLPSEISGVFYPGKKINGTYDAANKRIFWILPQSSSVQFVVNDLGIGGAGGQKAIPATATADYKDL